MFLSLAITPYKAAAHAGIFLWFIYLFAELRPSYCLQVAPLHSLSISEVYREKEAAALTLIKRISE